MIAQIESSGSKQIVRDAILGDATVIVVLDKYNHLFMNFVEIKNGMIVGVRECRLSNPLDESKEDIVDHAIIQYIVAE